MVCGGKETAQTQREADTCCGCSSTLHRAPRQATVVLELLLITAAAATLPAPIQSTVVEAVSFVGRTPLLHSLTHSLPHSLLISSTSHRTQHTLSLTQPSHSHALHHTVSLISCQYASLLFLLPITGPLSTSSTYIPRYIAGLARLRCSAPMSAYVELSCTRAFITTTHSSNSTDTSTAIPQQLSSQCPQHSSPPLTHPQRAPSQLHRLACSSRT